MSRVIWVMAAVVMAWSWVAAGADAPKEAGKKYGYLGVAPGALPPELSAQLGLEKGEGLLVATVAEGSPAAAAGLKVHDVIVKVDDQVILSEEQFRKLIGYGAPDATVKLDVIRKAAHQTVSVKLGATDNPPTMPPRASLRTGHGTPEAPCVVYPPVMLKPGEKMPPFVIPVEPGEDGKPKIEIEGIEIMPDGFGGARGAVVVPPAPAPGAKVMPQGIQVMPPGAGGAVLKWEATTEKGKDADGKKGAGALMRLFQKGAKDAAAKTIVIQMGDGKTMELQVTDDDDEANEKQGECGECGEGCCGTCPMKETVKPMR